MRFDEFAETLPKSKKEKEAELASALAHVEREGFVVHRPRPPESEAATLDISHLTGKDRIRLGIVSCTHFGSKYQQIIALREFCEYADRVAKVDAFVHGGDLEDGPVKRHKNPHEVFKHDYNAMPKERKMFDSSFFATAADTPALDAASSRDAPLATAAASDSWRLVNPKASRRRSSPFNPGGG